MEELFQELLQKKNVRESLITLKGRLRAGENPQSLKRMMEEKGNPFRELLRHEDPKVRKNAALLLGELGCQEELPQLFSAYQKEETLFVRADYLKAMQRLDYSACMPQLKERLDEMTACEIPPERQKHDREEIRQLKEMLLPEGKRERHKFLGMDRPFDLVLTTNRLHREVTAGQVRDYPVVLTPLGVRMSGAKPQNLFSIRTFREMLFALSLKVAGPDPVECGKALAASDLMEVLERGLGQFESCPFRITVMGSLTLEQRSSFAKRCGFELEQRTVGRLVNVPKDYELELRLYSRRDGTYLPLVKFSGLPDRRFSYRKRTVASSMHPSQAALMAALAKPYLKENGQVLDPFCGVGTMLLERDRAVAAGSMYGVDIFGEAVAGARENAQAAGRKIYFVHKDFMEFTHEYLFDEIFTDMPPRGKRTKEEQEQLYTGFFRQAARLLGPGGIIVMYSNEEGQIKKQLRLGGEFRLIKEFPMQEKGGYAMYIIGKRKA